MLTPTSNHQTRQINITICTEVLLLGGIAVLILSKWLRGYLDFYIHPRYTALMVVSAVVLLLMAAARIRSIFAEQPARSPGWLYVLLALPLLFGTLVPAQPLGADMLAGRGVDVTAAAPATAWQPSLDSDTTDWNLLQWATAISVDSQALDGKPVDVIGFVFHEQNLGADQFYVVRYVITCCAADGAGVGLPVVWPGGAALPANGWVRVQGMIGTTRIAASEQPAIMATAVEPINQPDKPYLYP